MKAVFLGIALLAISGCAGKTPPEAARVHGIAATDAPAIDACWRKVLTSPQHQALKEKMGDHADSPAAAMKSNPAMATPQEALLLQSLRQDYLAPCRKMALAAAAKVHPTIVAILTDSYARSDANTARLIDREITWGEYVSENQAIVTHRRAELLAAGERIQREQLPSPTR
ncbi:hypothetical protein SAMN02990966_07203 [Rhodospirillales bacterium URHD0017]|nr:hypothetical protein SAMN02990966_07203 [Rhodospirillales bacterium URHD0017]